MSGIVSMASRWLGGCPHGVGGEVHERLLRVERLYFGKVALALLHWHYCRAGGAGRQASGPAGNCSAAACLLQLHNQSGGPTPAHLRSAHLVRRLGRHGCEAAP